MQFRNGLPQIAEKVGLQNLVQCALLKAELGKFGLNGTDGVGPGVSSGLGIGAVCFQPLAKLLVSHLLPSSATHASVLTSRRCSTLLASSSSSFGLATMSASDRKS